MPDRWDIFCRVVDNFGDAGVCWRLARKLAREHGFGVRLWIDDLHVLRKLEPELADVPKQSVDGISVVEWTDSAIAAAAVDADVVIEAFGCGLPEAHVAAMAASAKCVLWIVLEYLSAEPWVREHHGLPSPHPRSHVKRYFFFPGFEKGTGGLLRERDLFARRDAFGQAQRCAFWRSLGHEPPSADADVVSIFGYDSAPLPELLSHWQQSPRQTVAVVPEGALAAIALKHMSVRDRPSARAFRRGSLELRIVRWIAQARYDELLWSCDANFVRGEDSFVRAQWAARPFVWHIYPQDERAHEKKLDAFLDLYCENLEVDAAAAVRGVMRTWNHASAAAAAVGQAWDAFIGQRYVLERHARTWAERIAAHGELAENLASFASDKLK